MYKIPCQNCKGHGSITHYKHVENGICFKCSGSGFQDATQAEYNDYKRQLERDKQGKYILFNNGLIEHYNTKKQIEKVYGNFFTGQYGNYAVCISYKDKNIVYTNHTNKANEFISATKNEYKKFIQCKINKHKEMLEGETDQEFIEMVNNKIRELEKSL